VHRPATYNISWTGQVTWFRPVTGTPVPLLRQRRWIAVLGSVGQPRDGNPAACYAMLDTDKGEITYFRVPYDVETAAACDGGKVRREHTCTTGDQETALMREPSHRRGRSFA